MTLSLKNALLQFSRSRYASRCARHPEQNITEPTNACEFPKDMSLLRSWRKSKRARRL